MTSARECPQCRRVLPSDAPSGVCPQCLLDVGRRSAAPPETADRRGGFVPPKPAELAEHFPQLDILDLVGHGGMGAVYKARQRGLDRLVALKILPPEAARDPSFAERFAREARALAKLSHPHIVAVHDSGCAGGHYYVLMEYVDGVNLREAIQTGELTPEEALTIVPQICEALQYAHDEGVVHRDIKPENILLDKKGTVKIADFGLARLLDQAPDNFTLTGTHQVMGTPMYMAPEQMEGSHEVDHRADIFSLGVVFYEMLTGELPLGRFDVPSKKVHIDVRLDEIVLRTLEKEPDRRYQAASEIKAAVETVHGMASLPPHSRQFYEYRSKATVFGWPLVHVCQGVDPRTHKKGIAKGVIAIGDVAVGGFAFGGLAFGGFTFGGVSLGLFSFGGVALGLLLAMGGAAVGLGVSIGGVAIGTVAVGGGAFGLWGTGVEGSILHRIGRPDHVRVWLPIFVVATASFGAVVVAVVSSIARRHAYPDGKPPLAKPPADRVHDRKPALVGCILASLVLLLALGCVIPGILFWSYSAARQDALLSEVRARQAQDSVIYLKEMKEADELDLNAGHWSLASEGPTLTPRGVRGFKLTPEQVPSVNKILQTVYQSYLVIERQHTTESIGNLGRLFTQIEPFSDAEIAELEQKLWSQLDEVLDIEQQADMRRRLAVHAGKGTKPISGNVWAPGILGWGRYGCRIELWKVGTWYHWITDIPGTTSRSYMPAGSAPELPIELKRFWRDGKPTAPASDNTSAH